MHFDFRVRKTLPMLSWCALIEHRSTAIVVQHGSRVETGPGFLVDGAWDGPFSQLGFGRSAAFTGTGALIRTDGVLFCAPSHPLERLYSIRTNGGLLFSNSMVFLLHQAGDGLDLDHPAYQFDFLTHYRAGLFTKEKALQTASGVSLRIHDRNVLVGPGLETSLQKREYGPRPIDYSEFSNFMFATVERVIKNAADRSRRHSYSAVSAVSKGYDSSAVSVLASRGGCRHAVTFRKSGHRTSRKQYYLDDDGSGIADRLGMSVSAFERHDAYALSELDPREHFVNVYQSTEWQTVMMADELHGVLFMTGRHGEQFWNLDRWASHPWFFDPCSVSLAGAASTESRLRIGYLNFPVPYTLGVHAPALNRISRSEEMAPWRMGTAYERPLARRLLEEVGVPRTCFGQRKMGGDDEIPAYRRLGKSWAEEFDDFYHEQVAVSIRSRLVEEWPGRQAPFLRGKMGNGEMWWRTRPLVRNITPSLLGDRLHHRYRCKYQYTFHWGFDGIRHRYAVPVEK